MSELEKHLGIVIFTSGKIANNVPLKKLNDLYDDLQNRSKLTDILNTYEGLARGVNLRLYDEKLVKIARKSNTLAVYSIFREFILHRRLESNNPELWDEFEKLVLKWELEDKKLAEKKR